jgi:hypothetical protein
MTRENIIDILRDSWNGGSYNDCADDIIDYVENNNYVFILERVERFNKVISIAYYNSYKKAKQAQKESNLKTQINVQKIY